MKRRSLIDLPLWCLVASLMVGLLTSCARAANDKAQPLALPAISAANLNGRSLRVVATTSIIGDVVSQVGGSAIQLTTLMGPGQDTHSYEAAARDLTAVADADLIFINGWNLEEGLISNLTAIAADSTPLVPVSAGITPLMLSDEADGTANHSADPHVWLAVPNVKQWIDTISATLQQRDPDRATLYTANAATYQAALDDLEQTIQQQLAQIPAENRRLVTNHDAFAYFAQAYNFDIIGTIFPATSSLADPSAVALAGLVEQMRAAHSCVIFSETAVSPRLAETVAAELTECAAVQIIPLYVGALGERGSTADDYIGLMQTNVSAIVAALQGQPGQP